MGFLTEIFGAKKGQPSVEEAEGKLALFRSERERAFTEIDTLRAKRKTLLAEDESDAAVRKVDDAIEGVELRLERLDLVEPGLVAELTGARDKRRQAEWEKVRTRYFGAADKLLRSARVALGDLETLRGVIDEARNKFGPESQHGIVFAPHPFFLAADVLNTLDRELSRVEAVSAPRQPAAIAPPPVQLTKPKPAQPAKSATAPNPAPVMAKPTTKRKPIIEPAGPGEVQARVQRNGYSKTDNGPQYSEGDIVALSAEKARVAIMNGALNGELQ